jgi:hypothetical protein
MILVAVSVGLRAVQAACGSDTEACAIGVSRPAWCIAFAFDPDRQAIVLVGRDKSGGREKRFYKLLIARADDRFDRHLERRKGQ